ncbi:hypothetical protein [Candidatus Nanohalococcus occultus]|uniref:hypothetical protein n=1 Tax=Candidatus Nanohalococcus occultus TaxID=2978047 RepID=UPI0039DF5994
MEKGSIPITVVVKLVISIFAALILITVIVPLLQAQRGNTMCVGPWRATASMVADMTGRNICG